LDKEQQASYLLSKDKVYRELAGLLISQGRLPEAQQVLKLLKQEEYFEFIRRSSNEGTTGGEANLSPEETEWERRYRDIADKIATIGAERGELLTKQKRTLAEEQHLANLERDLEVANQSFQTFLDQLSAEFSNIKESNYRIAALRDTQAMQSDLRELGRGTVALFTVVGEEKYRVILVTPDAQVAREYAVKSADLNRKVLEFREAVQNPGLDPRPLAQELYKIVVGPVANDLEQAHAKTLMWSLDGVLRYLPIAALHDGEGYLIQRYQTVIFTLASSARLKDRPSSNWRGLGLGVSKAIGNFPALPGVPTELRAVIREGVRHNMGRQETGLLQGKVMLDEAFTLPAMRAELRKRYPLVHIASHFLFKPGNENDSFLLLGNGEHLTLAEVKRAVTLFDGVELLTLSACDTATGGAGADGKEVEGFAVMAQRQGAKAVLAGLWPVVDNSTRLLMQDFYRLRINGTHSSKAEALRQAQLSLLLGATGTRRNVRLQIEKNLPGDYAHPFFWAPFILIGNWR
jgi:CHAT domain-containing protein